MRRTLAPRGLSRPRTLAAKVGTRHAHGCTQCSRRYTDACAYPGEDERCQICRGTPRPLWEAAYDPRPCCRAHAKAASTEVRSRYSLAGGASWFICGACARTHPFDPTRPTQES